MTYWISTGLIATMLVLSAGSYLWHQPTIEGVHTLGFPAFFRVELAVLKLAAALVLLLPHFPLFAKDWAYAGVALFLLTALIAHHVHRDPPLLNAINIALFGLLIVSRLQLTQLT